MVMRRILGAYAAALLLTATFAATGVTVNAEDIAEAEPLTGYSSLRKDSLIVGANAVILGKAEGGQLPYSYTYSYKSVTDKDWTDIPAEETAAMCRFTPEKPGRYDVRCTVTDAAGSTVTNEDRLLLWQDTGKEFANTTVTEDKTISLGESIVLETTAEGGRIPYETKYFVKSDRDDSYKQIRSYGESSQYSYTPKAAGYYTVKLRVRDAAGVYKDKTMRLTVVKKSAIPLKNNSTTDKKSITEKTAVTMKASALGGTAPYEYKYLYKKDGGSWVQLKGYSSKRPSLSFTPDSIGYYKLRVRIRDYDGNVCDKDIDLTVTRKTGKTLSNGSFVSSNFVEQKKSLTLSAKASGGVMPYKYKFYMYSDKEKKWAELNSYGTKTSYKLSLSDMGSYRFMIRVRDAEEKVSSKKFTVEVYSESKKTTAYTDLMKEARWSSGVLTYVPRGSTVYMYSKSGDWYKVLYGQTMGWMHKSAFGISDGTGLETMADNIIAQYGTSIQSLYNYANWTGYTGMNDLGYRDNIAYIMRYRRGACYQRACLLCFLLDRAGYTVIRVSNGIDRYTGGSPHNWVIISTNQGWRHIDPTPVIGLGKFYLVTDYAISPYFSWDRKKYPACV